MRLRQTGCGDIKTSKFVPHESGISSPPFCVFMRELGCFPRDSSAANPGPCVIRHEREPGNDPGLQALDCCEPLFNTLMSEKVLLGLIMSTVTNLTICCKNYFTEPLTNVILSGKWRKISVHWRKVEVDHWQSGTQAGTFKHRPKAKFSLKKLSTLFAVTL